jgi:hypothetical protein
MAAMRKGWLTPLVVLLVVFSAAGAPRRGNRIRLAHDLDVAAFESEDEAAGRVRLAFGPDGSLVVVFVVENPRGDVALVWRRVSPDGVVSAPTRIPLPDGFQRIAKPQEIVVGEDGVTSVGLRTHYRETSDAMGPYLEAAGEVVRVGSDGTVVGRRSLGVPVERIRLAAHDGVVSVAYEADGADAGDRAIFWRRIGHNGDFAGDAVRLSPPPEGSPQTRLTDSWDLFLSAAADGSERVLYRRVDGLFIDGEVTITVGPALFWQSISGEGEVSAPVSLGAVPDGVGSFKAALAPDGTVCVCTYRSSGATKLGTSFAPPRLVSADGVVREVEGEALPRVITGYPGEQYDLGADASSNFHLAVFATDGYRARPKKLRRIGRAVFLSTLDPDGRARPIERIPLRGKPEHIWSFHVASDGTRFIAGDKDVHPYHRNKKRRRQDVTLIFADPSGRTLRRKTFRSPLRNNIHQPLLASTSAGGTDRFAAAWSGWWSPAQPENRYVRVVVFER